LKRIKILYLQETDWIDKGPQQQHHLLERMSNKGHKIIVIAHEILWKENIHKGLFAKFIAKKSPPKACSKCNIYLVRPRFLRIKVLIYFSMLFFYLKTLIVVIKKFKPDIIMGGGILTVTIGQVLAKINKVPYIHLTTDKWHDAIPEKLFRTFGLILESRLAHKANYNIVINEQLKEYETRIGADPKTTKVLRAGVELDLFKKDLDERRRMRKKLGFSEQDTVLFFMGWLYTFSGLKEIIEEMNYDQNNKIKLCIVGKGELLNEILRLRIEYKLEERIKIIDWVRYRDLPRYLSVADICLLPAYNNKTMNEIVPIKIYEYLSAEKPVVTTRLPGVMREFKKNNGVIYAEDSRTVYSIATNLTEKERVDLGEKGRKFVEKNCNWVEIVNEFEKIVVDLISKKDL